MKIINTEIMMKIFTFQIWIILTIINTLKHIKNVFKTLKRPIVTIVEGAVAAVVKKGDGKSVEYIFILIYVLICPEIYIDMYNISI